MTQKMAQPNPIQWDKFSSGLAKDTRVLHIVRRLMKSKWIFSCDKYTLEGSSEKNYVFLIVVCKETPKKWKFFLLHFFMFYDVSKKKRIL